MGNTSDLAASCGSVNDFAATILPAIVSPVAKVIVAVLISWTIGMAYVAGPSCASSVCRAASESALNFGCQSIPSGENGRSEKGKTASQRLGVIYGVKVARNLVAPSEYLPGPRRMGQGNDLSMASFVLTGEQMATRDAKSHTARGFEGAWAMLSVPVAHSVEEGG